MDVLLLEPYFTGSHRAWALGLQAHSSHHVEILSLPGEFWKWRMHGGAVTLAKKFLEGTLTPDVILATDMLDLTTFQALTRQRTAQIPFALYFHENQITYPWSPRDRDVQKERDRHYGFINFTSALSADAVFFNSKFHKDSFLSALPHFLKQFPDYNPLETIPEIEAKSQVLPLGLELARFDRFQKDREKFRKDRNIDAPLILWNHRWEYDKNPVEFFQALLELDRKNIDFQVAVLGENFRHKPFEFLEAKEALAKRIVQWGYVDTFEEYAQWLWAADILPVTSFQDFFGISVMEAVYCGCVPLLPNRLAYPEFFREANNLFYNSFEQLVDLLTNLIHSKASIHLDKISKIPDPFQWKTIIPAYDQVLLDLHDRPITK